MAATATYSTLWPSARSERTYREQNPPSSFWRLEYKLSLVCTLVSVEVQHRKINQKLGKFRRFDGLGCDTLG